MYHVHPLNKNFQEVMKKLALVEEFLTNCHEGPKSHVNNHIGYHLDLNVVLV